MKGYRIIWNYEVRQAERIARHLIRKRKVELGWGILFLPNLLLETIHFRRTLGRTRKNLLFTRRKAIKAAREVARGGDRALQMGYIEIETKDLLDRERKGFYTEKVRRKQTREVELLVDHFLLLMNTKENTYEGMVRGGYPSGKEYLAFLNRLQQAEEEVIQAAITSVRKGSKKERLNWFKGIRETTRRIRREEASRIFPEGSIP